MINGVSIRGDTQFALYRRVTHRPRMGTQTSVRHQFFPKAIRERDFSWTLARLSILIRPHLPEADFWPRVLGLNQRSASTRSLVSGGIIWTYWVPKAGKKLLDHGRSRLQSAQLPLRIAAAFRDVRRLEPALSALA